MHKFSTHHSTHGEPVVAVFAARAERARNEVQLKRGVRIALVERRRPVGAVGACGGEIATVAIAGSREEDGIAVRTGYPVTISTVLGGQYICAV